MEELPKGVMTETGPDGRTTAWVFPSFGWGKLLCFCAGLVVTLLILVLLFVLVFLIPRRDLHVLTIVLCVVICPIWLILAWRPYLRMRLNEVKISEEAVCFRVLRRRTCIKWEDIVSLYLARKQDNATPSVLRIRGESGERIELSIGYNSKRSIVKMAPRARFLTHLIIDRFNAAMGGKLQAVLNGETTLEVVRGRRESRRGRRFFWILDWIFLPVLVLAVCVCIDAHEIRINGIVLLATVGLTLGLVAFPLLRRRRFSRILVSQEGLLLPEDLREFGWTDIARVECKTDTESSAALTCPLKIWLIDSTKPLVILPSAKNYNLLLALMQEKGFCPQFR